MNRTPDEILDELLVLRSQDGDKQAWRNLVGRWNSRLLAQAYQATGRADMAADLTQETWLAVLRAIDSLHDPARFPAWVSRILTNKISDWARRHRTEQGVLAEELQRAQQQQHAPAPQHDLLADRLRKLRETIRGLEPEKRELLAMFYTQGRSLNEIAQALQIPEGTVKSRLHYLRQELKHLMEQNEHDGNR
jgi:RNA polymerase sigma-70 factor (ECF subfamily)